MCIVKYVIIYIVMLFSLQQA